MRGRPASEPSHKSSTTREGLAKQQLTNAPQTGPVRACVLSADEMFVRQTSRSHALFIPFIAKRKNAHRPSSEFVPGTPVFVLCSYRTGLINTRYPVPVASRVCPGSPRCLFTGCALCYFRSRYRYHMVALYRCGACRVPLAHSRGREARTLAEGRASHVRRQANVLTSSNVRCTTALCSRAMCAVSPWTLRLCAASQSATHALG